jgi:endoglucanase
MLRDWYTGDYGRWYESVRGTPADLNLFYRKVIKAIRQVDRDTPIVLDAGFYATPWGMMMFDPSVIGDPNVIYSFHMYEPGAFIGSGNDDGQFRYPGLIPTGELDVEGRPDSEAPYAPMRAWNTDAVRAFLAPVTEWQEKHGIPSSRIFVGEFGVRREHEGAGAYLSDLIDVFEEKGWHWAFYAFREDTGFQQMDYELGTEPTPAAYWDAYAAGRFPGADVYKENSLFQVLKRGLRRNRGEW